MSNYYNRQWRLPNSWNGTESNVNKQSNYSLSFDGSSQYIDCGNSIYQVGTGDVTISAWANTSTTALGNVDIFGLGDNTTSEIRLQRQANKFGAYVNSSTASGQQLVGATTISTGQWYSVILVKSSNVFTLYLNGVSDNNITWTGGALNATGGSIGAYFGGGSNRFNGQIDGVSIYNYALSSSQITTLYGSSSTGIGNPMSLSPKPVAFYPLGDQDSFNGSNYLVPNSSLKDYVFDFGTFTSNDRIVINDTFDTIITGTNFTISSWINLDSVASNQLKFIFTNESLQFTITDKITTYLRGASGYFLNPFDSNTTLSTGKWYNVVLVKNGSDYTYYLNGSSDGTVNNSTSVVNSSETTSLIGDYYGTGTLGFDGRISNTQIFNTALPATGSNSIETLYNNGSPLTSMSGFTSLQGWWKLDASATYDSSTTTWTIPDDSTNSNDGTSSGMNQSNLVQSDLSFTSGYSPYALDFDGANDYISLNSINLGTTNTISLWYNGEAILECALLGNDDAPNDYTIWIMLNGTLVAFKPDGPSSSIDWNVANVNDGNWHHFAFSRTNTTINLYIDGNLQTVNSNNLTNNNTKIDTIGAKTNGSYPFKGKLSNISIWNTNLTSTQVTEIYNEGVPSNLNNHSAYSNLVSWWQLGSNSSFNTNWTVLDEKGSNNGTSVNMTESDIVDGVGSYANGTSSGMGGDEVVGDAPYSSSNSLSVNMDVEDRVEDTPS